jgi:hypothetical protein
MSTYYVGDTIRIAATFRSPANALVDPDTVTLTFTLSGNSTTYTYGTSTELINPTVGSYVLNYTAGAAGNVSYVWESTGASTVTRSGGFNVLASRVTPSSFWTPANDHLVFDNLETISITSLAGNTTTVLRVFRLPANLDTAGAGSLTAYGTTTQWNMWIQECPVAPEINALITDAYGRKYRIDSVMQSVVQNMWEVSSTADAGASLRWDDNLSE